MKPGDVKIGDVIKAGLPDEPVIVLDILKSETTEHIAAIKATTKKAQSKTAVLLLRSHLC